MILTTACSPLTKTQLKSVNQYYQTLGPFPSYYRELQKYTANIKLNRLLLYPESYKVDSVMIESLVKSFENYSKDMIIFGKTDSAIITLDNYIRDYFLLLPNGFRLIKIITSGTSAIGKYFGIGDVMQSVMPQKGVYISKTRARKIKEYIRNGNSLVTECTDLMKSYSGSLFRNNLSNENIYIRENYKKFLADLKDKPGSYEYYAVYNKIFINHFQTIYNTQLYVKQLKKVIDNIKLAQFALNELTDSRENLKQGIPEIHDLYIEMSKLKNIQETIKILELSNEHILSPLEQ